MFKNILVPLDGSKLAETAVSPAASLAKTLGAPVTLLHIIEKDAPQEVHSDHHLTKPDEASAYLQKVALSFGLSLLVIIPGLIALALWGRHFPPFQAGVINLRDVAYYLLVTYFALFAATRVLEARRWQ